MKIIKYEKLKSNKYKIYLDNDEDITLYDDVILNNNLLLTKEIEDTQELLDINNIFEAYNKAIKYIGVKLRTKKELKNYLKRYYEDYVIEDVVDKIINNNYLDDELYIKSYINDQLNLSNNGYYKILRNLKNKDLDEDLIIKYLDNIEHSVWIEKIDKIISKKIKTNNKYSSNYLKEKILYDLNNLGYDKTDILNTINNYSLKDDSDILKKNYDSLYNKLSKKYSGNELKLQLINKLMAKGFKYNEIKKII